MNWLEQAACRKWSPLLWQPNPDTGKYPDLGLAKRICASCPVANQCATEATKHDRPDLTTGMWAGTTTYRKHHHGSR